MATDRRTSLLLQLPPELHVLIAKELPLSTHLFYRTQICSFLRKLFDGQLKLPKAHRFDLVEWKRARREVGQTLARQQRQSQTWQESDVKEEREQGLKIDTSIKSIWDTSPSSTPRPAPPKSAKSPFRYPEMSERRNHEQNRETDDILVYRNHPDVAFFVRCMHILGNMDVMATNSNSAPMQRPWSGDILVLSLLSRGGFKVASLIQLLETQSSLQHVETIVMTSTSFVDTALWTVFTPPKIKAMRSQSTPLEDSPRTCIDTQAIVIPGPCSKKGHGLRSGFKCLCFSLGQIRKATTAKDIASNNAIDQPLFPFHIIIHDPYDEDEAIGIQDMLEHSDITCNACKQKIRY